MQTENKAKILLNSTKKKKKKKKQRERERERDPKGERRPGNTHDSMVNIHANFHNSISKWICIVTSVRVAVPLAHTSRGETMSLSD